MKEWPSVEYGDSYKYQILSHTSDDFPMKNYKSLDRFYYFQSGSVDRVMHYILEITTPEVRPQDLGYVYCDLNCLKCRLFLHV